MNEHLNLTDTFTIDGERYRLFTVRLPLSVFASPGASALYEITLMHPNKRYDVSMITILFREHYHSAEEAKARHKELVEKARNGVKFWKEE